MGYDHRNTTGMKQSVDYVTCPECFTKQYKTAANYAPDSWRETNAASSSMADRAVDADTETYQIVETVNAYRTYDFQFPEDLSWGDVRHHEIDWVSQEITITWTDGTESCFGMSYGELGDFEDTDDVRIQNYDGDQVW
jgi:hypothetical protein